MSKKTHDLDRLIEMLVPITRCELCGSNFGVQRHHIIKRRYRVFRWEIINNIPLCLYCHKEAEEEQEVFMGRLRMLASLRYEWYLANNKNRSQGTLYLHWYESKKLQLMTALAISLNHKGSLNMAALEKAYKVSK